VLGFPIEMKWMNTPLPMLKKYLQQAIDALEGDDDNPHIIDLKARLRDIIPQMRQQHGIALDTELSMLDALCNS